MDTVKRMELKAAFHHWCPEHGLKVTSKRWLIYEELMQSRDHPSPEILFSRLQAKRPPISLDTVYRTLATFYETALVDMVEGFALTKRFDPNQGPHHHVRCTQCHSIIDFEDPKFDQLEIPASVRKSFDVQRVRVTIEGLCLKCQLVAKKKG